MKHWEHRPEKSWKEFTINQPYAKGLERLREEVLAKTDFDPATLWRATDEEGQAWERYTAQLEAKALRIAVDGKKEK